MSNYMPDGREVTDAEFRSILARAERLDAGLREIASEVSAIGCEGPFDDVCHEYTAPKEDWCPWCRIGATINAARSPASGGADK